MASKDKVNKWVDFVAGVVKECTGEAKVEDTSEKAIKITWGKDGNFAIGNDTCEKFGRGGTRDLIIQQMRIITDNPELLSVDKEVEEAAKRKLGAKAEGLDKAMDIAGSSSKEKNEILKDA